MGTQTPETINPDALTHSELIELKQTRLQYTIEYAYEHSPYYRDVMNARGLTPAEFETTDDLTKFPITTPSDIRANQPPATDDYRFLNPEAKTRRQFYTSGTTGEPKSVFRSYDEMARIYENVRRGHEHFGITEDDLAVDYFPFVGLNMSLFGTEGGMEALGIETLPISNTQFPVDHEAALLLSRKPTVLMGLASYIDSKGMQFINAGHDPTEFGVEKVICAGEPVSESRKAHLGSIYDAEVYDYLGSTEGGAFAFECLDGEGLHVLDDAVHIEVVDPDTVTQCRVVNRGVF